MFTLFLISCRYLCPTCNIAFPKAHQLKDHMTQDHMAQDHMNLTPLLNQQPVESFDDPSSIAATSLLVENSTFPLDQESNFQDLGNIPGPSTSTSNEVHTHMPCISAAAEKRLPISLLRKYGGSNAQVSTVILMMVRKTSNLYSYSQCHFDCDITIHLYNM